MNINSTKKETNHTIKFYGILGQLLCALAGGIIGFTTNNLKLIIPGILIGAFIGNLLEKYLSPTHPQ